MLARSAAISASTSASSLAGDAPAQVLEDALRRLDADIGAEQPRLELLEDRRIDLASLEQLREVVGEPGVAAVEPLAQAPEEPGAFVGCG